MRRLLRGLPKAWPGFSTLLFFVLIRQITCEDLTEVVPTLTSLGSLGPFTPPADCFTTSAWRSSKFFDDSNQSGVFQTRFFTRWYVGCNVDDETGEVNTCCPPRYKTWGFYAPGVCPQGYSTVPNNVVNPWVGDQRGTVCCPVVKDPSTLLLTDAAFATGFINPLDRDPVSISCYEWASSATSKNIVYQGNFNARAIIVFGESLTSLTFKFAQSSGDLPTERPPTSTSSNTAGSTTDSDTTPSSTAEGSPSPGSTTESGAAETGPGGPSTVSSSSSTSSSGASATDSSASQSQAGEGGRKSGLSGGAIAGIAIGVSVPVIAAAVFFAYRLGRRRDDVPVVPIYNDPQAKEGEGYGYHAGPNTAVQDQWS
ncbi:hypothetical protein ABW21_db0203670 [Orbilia brochopaga]|nr:hypothetical protein ABW21_db0203670 [Drechslerella brochopaga]